MTDAPDGAIWQMPLSITRYLLMLNLIQTHSSTSQGSFICRHFVVVDISYCFGMYLTVLALNSNLTGQHIWLLQPLFSHSKSLYIRISIFYLNQTQSYTSQGRFICRVLWWIGSIFLVWNSATMRQGSTFGYFSQFSS